MKAKFDKEFLLKHRFWFMLAVVPLLWLIAWLVLITGVAQSRDQKRKQYEELLHSLRTIQNPKNPRFIKPLEKKEAELKAHKDKVWKQVWKSQEGIMTWPSSDIAPMKALEKGYFGDPIPDRWRREYGRAGLYAKQLDEFKRPPPPTYYLGGWETIIQPVSSGGSPGHWATPPTIEECWLAQEERWVRRELLSIVKDTLNAVARFDDVNTFKVIKHDYAGKEGVSLPEGAVAVQVARNPYWEMELILQQKPRKELEKPVAEKPEKPASKEGTPAAEGEPPAAEPVEPAEGGKPARKEPPILVVSPQSRLTNVDRDKKPRQLEGLVIRLSQRRPILDAEGKVLREVSLEKQFVIQGESVDWNKHHEFGQLIRLDFDDKELQQLKIDDRDARAIRQGGVVQFDLREPIQVRIVEDKSDPVPPGFVARQRLRNANWELELLLEEERRTLYISSKSTLRNIHPNQRTLNLNGVRFNVRQGAPEQQPVVLRVQGMPLPWGQSVSIGVRQPVPNFSRDLDRRPLLVEQVLEWSTSPIRRIDQMAIGYHSHRTANSPLEKKTFIDTPTTDPSAMGAEGAVGTEGGVAGESAPPVGEVPAPGPLPSFGEGFGPGMLSGNRTPNGLERNRYYQVNNQVRRLPLGLVLVVDQAHIQDVLTAFINSRLRIQTTQVHWHHIRDVPPPTPADLEGGVADPSQVGQVTPGYDEERRGTAGITPGPGGRSLFPRAGFGPGAPLSGFRPGIAASRGEGGDPEGGRPGFGRPLFTGGIGSYRGPTGETMTGPDGQPLLTDDPNLVQLCLYGIASLYERYPPKPAPAGDSANPGGQSASGTTP